MYLLNYIFLCACMRARMRACVCERQFHESRKEFIVANVAGKTNRCGSCAAETVLSVNARKQ